MNKDLELALEYDFNYVLEFYTYIYYSYLNGNKKQSLDLFKQISDKDMFFLSTSLTNDHDWVEFLEFLLKN